MKKLILRPCSVDDLVNMTDEGIETFSCGEFDGYWRQAVKDRVSDLSGVVGSLTFRAGFLLTPRWWRCPSCLRDKLSIIRKTKAGVIHCRLVHHHDHIADILDVNGENFGFQRRFQTVVICESCNLADADAKAKVGAPKWFSFEPFDIRRFINVSNDGRVLVDADLAQDVWNTGKMKAFINLVETIVIHLNGDPMPKIWGKGPQFYTPFVRNSKPIDGMPYVQDGYLQSFRDAMYRVGLQISDISDDFQKFATRSGGTTRG